MWGIVLVVLLALVLDVAFVFEDEEDDEDEDEQTVWNIRTRPYVFPEARTSKMGTEALCRTSEMVLP